jgi:hypothetical protein
MEPNESLSRALWLSRWLARAFAFVCYVAPVALLLLGTAFVTFYEVAFSDLQSHRLGTDMPPHLDVTRRWLLVATAGLYGAPLVVAAAYLRRLFESFSANAIFTTANVTRLRLIGRWLLVAAVAANVSQLLFLAILRDPREGFHLTVLPVLYAAMIYVIAYVLEEANRMADYNAKIV